MACALAPSTYNLDKLVGVTELPFLDDVAGRRR